MIAAVPSIATLDAEEAARARHDPNYQWLVAEINTIDAMRDEHTVSLNLAQRRAQRAHDDKTLLSLDNRRRAALGLAPLTSAEQIDKDKDKIPDVILDQAADITADLIALDRSSYPIEKTASTGAPRN